MKALSFRSVAVGSLLFTYLFFFEYLPPFRRVHIPFDLHDFHYPLADYAFQRLKQGQFPQWDPTIYSGMSFVGNTQAALFYPPTWLLFAANLGRSHISYQSLEDLVFAHVWVGFFLCYLWLRGRRFHQFACLCGAGIFAFSGYACLQLQHLGLIGGYVWIPLALWGIDQAIEKQSWRPLWKLSLASSLCLLAGYPPMWCVFIACVITYALCRNPNWTMAATSSAALILSLGLAMVQLLPALEAYRSIPHERDYWGSAREAAFYISYAVPNYFDFDINTPIDQNPAKEYLYLGVPAFLGVAFLLFARKLREAVPFLAIGFVCFIALNNPFNLVWALIRHSQLLSGLVRDWFFLAGFTLAASGLATIGLDSFLNGEAHPRWQKARIPVSIALALWAALELIRWALGGTWLPSGPQAIFDPLITSALTGFTLLIFRESRGREAAALAILLLAAFGIDYKVFGTSKRVNAALGESLEYTKDAYPGMDPSALAEMLRRPEYRLVFDQPEDIATHLRHIGLQTPQGFDPLLTANYKSLVTAFSRFDTDRLFVMDPRNEAALKLLGVRFIVSTRHGSSYSYLSTSTNFRRIDADESYYQVFEYTNAEPTFGFESPGEITPVERSPEERRFLVHSAGGGRFVLREQFFPGWSVSIDQQYAPVELWQGAFQSAQLPPGEHELVFRFHDRALLPGALISAASLLVLFAFIRVHPRPNG